MSFLTLLVLFVPFLRSATLGCGFRKYTTLLIQSIDGSEKTNAHVLISLDTEAMISAGDLRSDCTDLAFSTDPLDFADSTQYLSYFQESACNIPSTNFWVRVPTVPASVTMTLYLLHDCPASYSTSKRLTWSGEFIAPRLSSSCTGSWSSVSSIVDRYPRIAASTSLTGIQAPSSHLHHYSGTVPASLSSAEDVDDPDAGEDEVTAATVAHTHTYDQNSRSVPNTFAPGDALMLQFCQSRYLDFTLSGLLVPFTLTSLPPLATHSSLTNGLYLLGGTSYTGASIPRPSSDHSHDMHSSGTGTVTTDSVIGTVQVDDWATEFTVDNTHTHTATASMTTDALPEPLFIEIDFATVVSTYQPNPGDGSSLFGLGDIPPLGWILHPWVTTYAGRLLKSTSVSVNTGTLGGSSTHTHSYSFSTDWSAAGSEGVDWGLSVPVANDGHTHPSSGGPHVTDSAPNDVASFDLVMFRQKVEVVNVSFSGSVTVDLTSLTCDSIASTNVGVCGGNGACVATDTCSCSVGYSGTFTNCDYWTCHGTSKDSASVCGGASNGHFCEGYNLCDCSKTHLGTTISTVTKGGSQCTLDLCYGEVAGDPAVCDGHGTCTGFNQCNCEGKYTGDDCEIADCYGVKSDNTLLACSGHGRCAREDHCMCDGGWEGNQCQTEEGGSSGTGLTGSIETTIVAIAGGVGGTIGFFVVVIVIVVVVVQCQKKGKGGKGGKKGSSGRKKRRTTGKLHSRIEERIELKRQEAGFENGVPVPDSLTNVVMVQGEQPPPIYTIPDGYVIVSSGSTMSNVMPPFINPEFGGGGDLQSQSERQYKQ